MTPPLIRIAQWVKGWSGASGSDIFDCEEVADAAWGKRARDENSGLLAYAYLWRRFGPTDRGGDPHKDLVAYTLTTPDPQVRLWLHLSGSKLYLSLGYFAHPDIRSAIEAEHMAHVNAYEAEFLRLKGHPGMDDAGFEALPKDEQESLKKEYQEMLWQATDDGRVLNRQIHEAVGPHPRAAEKAAKARVQSACITACKDLLRPVWIRDVPINIFGRCEPKGRTAKPYKFAGYGIDVAAHEKKWRKE